MRNPDWDLAKHKLLDIYSTIEGKIVPLVAYKDILKAEEKMKGIGIKTFNKKINDRMKIVQNMESVLC
jgi:hypothetical protein